MRAYKHLSSLAILCLAGAAMMVAGCVKGNLSTNDDLQFTAQSSIETKAVYGSDAGDYQRIIWQDGDEVTIASDQAQTLWGRSFCDYIVTPEDNDATASTRESKGRIKRKTTVNGNSEDSGLRWNDNASGTANFWSVYPATNDAGIQSGIVNATISSSTSLDLSTNQPSGNVIKILDPRKGSYPMVAHGTADANTNLVKLQYYPAFTAFQITLFNNTNSQITLKSCSLSSTTSNLSGTFTASIDALATDAPSHPVLSNLTGEGKTVTVGVTDVLDNGKGVTFSIFCLPQDLTDLTFNVTYIDSNGEQSRSLRLEQNDTALTFEACKQHRFSLTLTESGGLNFEISEVMKIILANAFPDLFDYSPQYGEGYQLYHHGTNNRVSEEEIRAAILLVTEVTIPMNGDYGRNDLPYTAEDMAVFVNLQTFRIDQTTSIPSITIDGLPNFQTFDMIYADNIHNVSISNCPMTETVNINSQSLETLTFDNLDNLKYLTINEGTANSNLKTLTVTDCPDLEVADLGLVGKLTEIDFTDCSNLTTLNIGLAYALENLELDGCTALKTLYINEPNSLKLLNTDECTSIESIILVNPRSLLEFESHSTTLKELKFIGGEYEAAGAQQLVRLELDTPALTTFHFVNLSNLNSLTLANLSSSITNFGRFLPPPQYGKLTYLSITACNGFQSVEVDPSYGFQEMHFDSCTNLSSVTLKYCYTGDSSITATKHNCPNLGDFVINNGTPRTVPFTEL